MYYGIYVIKQAERTMLSFGYIKYLAFEGIIQLSLLFV